MGLPCEIRFKIFDHVSVADLTKWLKIQKLRDSILAFLEDEGKVSFQNCFHGPSLSVSANSGPRRPYVRAIQMSPGHGGQDFKSGQLKEKP